MYPIPVVKLLLSFVKIIHVNLIQYLLYFYYSTALGTRKHTSRVCDLEVLGHALTECVVCWYLAMHMCPTLGIFITYCTVVACYMAHKAFTLRAASLGFSTA